MDNRRIVIESLPEDKLTVDNFAMRTAPIPEPGAGELFCRTLALTVGAGQRAGLQGSANYAGALLATGRAARRVVSLQTS